MLSNLNAPGALIVPVFAAVLLEVLRASCPYLNLVESVGCTYVKRPRASCPPVLYGHNSLM